MAADQKNRRRVEALFKRDDGGIDQWDGIIVDEQIGANGGIEVELVDTGGGCEQGTAPAYLPLFMIDLGYWFAFAPVPHEASVDFLFDLLALTERIPLA